MLRRNNGYVPDILDCLANLSNDEVLTPPKVASAMLDMLPQEVFQSTETTFLDPFTKSGVFLREITKRLLANQVPNYVATSNEIEMLTKEAIQNAVSSGKLDLNDKDYEEKARALGDAAIKNSPKATYYMSFEKDLQAALDHILTKQVFGIAITELTAQLSRRSLYCSKNAAGKYSVTGNAFCNIEEGNIRFVPMKHTWRNGSCIYCGASASNLDRPDEYESHAYEFIHRENLEEIFMGFQFTVVCGNPPYQLEDEGAFASASPIYHKFVQQAMRLNPKYLTMIIPSRWFSGGKGLDEFRNAMLHDDRIRILHDYPIGGDCFPGIRLAGGVCYFLWCRDERGTCNVFNHSNGDIQSSMTRPLLEDGADSFIRMNQAVSIFRKVHAFHEDSFASLVSSRKPFGLPTDFFANPAKYGLPDVDDEPTATSKYRILGVHKYKEVCKYANYGYPFPTGIDKLDKYKVFVARALDAGFDMTKERLKPVLGLPNDACTEKYLVVGG